MGNTGHMSCEATEVLQILAPGKCPMAVHGNGVKPWREVKTRRLKEPSGTVEESCEVYVHRTIRCWRVCTRRMIQRMFKGG